MSKIDYWHLGSRAAWQLPEKVLESLKIRPGQKVIDLGAGRGYFTFYLAQGVGKAGRVYAVDVDQKGLLELKNRAAQQNLDQISVIKAENTGFELREKVDLIFICNTYHHIENRVAYFDTLQRLLKPGGRIAVVDHRNDLGGILRLFLSEGHWFNPKKLKDEMAQVGVRHVRSYDYLPTQFFEIFVTKQKEREI